MEDMEEPPCDKSNKTEDIEDLGFLNLSLSQNAGQSKWHRYIENTLEINCF